MKKLFVSAFLLRWFIFETELNESFTDRVEIVTPLTSWIRLKECIALTQYNLSPYSGDACHHPPILIALFALLDGHCSFVIPYLFILLDMFAAYFLMKAAILFIQNQIESQKLMKVKEDAKVLLMDEEDLVSVPYLVALIYLYNPVTIATCVAASTGSVVNFFLSSTLLALVKGHHCGAAVLLSMATYMSLYPVMLLVPIILRSISREFQWIKAIKVTLTFIASTISLLFVSYKVYDTWDFLDAVYIFILNVPDLSPNIGLFWYFFLEMFEHFRLFFLWVLQIHAFVYLIPFTLVFRKHPVFFFYTLLSVMSWSKSYPSISDLALPLTLLPLWSNVFRYFRSLFVSAVMMLFSTILAPVLYHLWVYAGSGNANFFYAATLSFNLAQILLLSDVIYGFLRREFHLKHGLHPLTEAGEQGFVVMK